jgi:hypothetical protein
MSIRVNNNSVQLERDAAGTAWTIRVNDSREVTMWRALELARNIRGSVSRRTALFRR